MAEPKLHQVEASYSDLRNQPQISRALKARRKALGMTQQETAQRANVSVQWLSGFENSKGSCGLRRVMRVVDVLGLSLALHIRPRTELDQIFDSITTESE